MGERKIIGGNRDGIVRLLFVCHSNICRSPMGEFVMRELLRRRGLAGEVWVDSKACTGDGLGEETHPGTQRVLREQGIPFEARRPRVLRREDYAAYDLILAMDEENMGDLRRIFRGDPEGKCHLLLAFAGEGREVADPWYTGDFERTYREVLLGCQGVLRRLLAGRL